MKTRSRPGFTLIELIVVISIMLIVASMIVAVAYTASTKQAVGTGANNLVGWLKTVQAYALRDQKPYGLRLNTTGTNLVTVVQYIEQPSDWTGPVGNTVNSTATAGGSVATITANPPPTTNPPTPPTDFSGGWGGSWSSAWPIGPGDYFENGSPGSGSVGQIASVTSTGLSVQLWEPDSPAPATGGPWNQTGISSWRIIRQPRPMIGSDPLSLPTGVAININTNGTYGGGLPAGSGAGNANYDILFSPTGAVVNSPGRDIKLWLIDMSQNPSAATQSTFQGEQFIVTIAVRSGLISIHPVDVTGAAGGSYTQPYSFSQDGRSSGF